MWSYYETDKTAEIWAATVNPEIIIAEVINHALFQNKILKNKSGQGAENKVVELKMKQQII